MKLLVLTNNPTRASFRQRIKVYLNIFYDNGIVSEVGRFAQSSLGRYKLLKRAAMFDAVFLHKKRLNLFDAFWLRYYARKVIYDFDDAVMYDDKNPDKPSGKRLKSFRRTVELADLIIAGNEYLAEHARKFNTNVEVLPTGLNTNSYKFESGSQNDGTIRLVWIGSKSTLKYLLDIRPALEEVGRRFENVILRIICDEFFDMENMHIEKCSWSLQAQTADLASSDIGIAPLPDNRFTCGKCGFKILQYASAGLPVIASPVGVNAEYVKDGATGLFATSTREWVDRITQLVKNAQLRKKMGRENLAMAQEFDVCIVGKKLVGLILDS